MKLSELKEEAKNDTHLTFDILSKKAIQLGSLKSKWVDFYSQELLVFKKLQAEYNILKIERWQYYSFDYDYVVDKKTINDILLVGDAKLSKKQLEIDLSKEKLNFIEKTQSILNAMGFDIKNTIEWEKFKAGEY